VSPSIALGLLAIFALSPFFVYYGQQARPYALLAFLSAANLLAFIRVLERPDLHRRMAVWAILCTLLLYTSYLGILFIAFQVGVAVFRLRSVSLTIVAYGLTGSALIIPWFIVAMGGAILKGVDPLPHISWISPPTPGTFFWFYGSLFGTVPGVHLRWMLLLQAVLGIAYLRQMASSKKLPTDHLLLFLISIGLPAIVYIVSVWGPKPVFASRQLLGAGIASVAAIGLCLATLPKRLAAGFLAVLLVWTAAALPEAFPHKTKPPWRDIAIEIHRQHGPSTVVAEEDWVSEPLSYYWRAGSIRLWSGLEEHEKGNRLLVVCRPLICSAVESDIFKSRRSLLATWPWGPPRKTAERDQIRLYEIRSINEGS
jgi:hypothetical protein